MRPRPVAAFAAGGFVALALALAPAAAQTPPPTEAPTTTAPPTTVAPTTTTEPAPVTTVAPPSTVAPPTTAEVTPTTVAATTTVPGAATTVPLTTPTTVAERAPVRAQETARANAVAQQRDRRAREVGGVQEPNADADLAPYLGDEAAPASRARERSSSGVFLGGLGAAVVAGVVLGLRDRSATLVTLPG